MCYSICINTYKRPKLLEKLLLSLINQELKENIFLEIIVVDNDPDLTAKQIVGSIMKESRIPIKYYAQPIKNISITRNLGLSKASGDYIFFIDDDEYANSDWINRTIECMKQFNADGVFGVVLSYFDSEVPKWLSSNPMYNRQIQKTGTFPIHMRTGNCLIKKNWLLSINGPFDIKYGLTGGEDSHLFNILASNGAKFVFCAESIVNEFVPKERANIKWLCKRSMMTGNRFARRILELSSSIIITKLFLLSKAIVLFIFNLILAVIFIFSIKHFTSYLTRSASYIGHILGVFNIYFDEYK